MQIFERYVLPMRSARREILIAEAIGNSGATLGCECPVLVSRRPFRPFWWPALTAVAMASAAAFGVLYFASQT